MTQPLDLGELERVAFLRGARMMQRMIAACLKDEKSPNGHVIRRLVDAINPEQLPMRLAEHGITDSGETTLK